MVNYHLAILMTFAAIGSGYTYGQQIPQTLGQLWPKVEKTYVGLKAKSAAIESAQLDVPAFSTFRAVRQEQPVPRLRPIHLALPQPNGRFSLLEN